MVGEGILALGTSARSDGARVIRISLHSLISLGEKPF